MSVIARPVWDKLLASTSITKLDMRFLPYQQSFTAKLKAWRHDGALVEHTKPFFHACTWKVGDADGNGVYSISDVTRLVNYIFGDPPGAPPTPHEIGSGDADCSGGVNISDAVRIVNYIYSGGLIPGLGCSCADYY
jgi:hypothetical protein